MKGETSPPHCSLLKGRGGRGQDLARDSWGCCAAGLHHNMGEAPLRGHWGPRGIGVAALQGTGLALGLWGQGIPGLPWARGEA